MRRQLAINLR